MDEGRPQRNMSFSILEEMPKKKSLEELGSESQWFLSVLLAVAMGFSSIRCVGLGGNTNYEIHVY